MDSIASLRWFALLHGCNLACIWLAQNWLTDLSTCDIPVWLKIDPNRCPESDITLARHKNRWGKTGRLLSYIFFSFVVQWPMRSRLTFVFRLNHKQTLKMTTKLLLDNNKTFSWNKTIIDFGICCYLVLSTFKNVYSPRLRLGEYYICSGW